MVSQVDPLPNYRPRGASERLFYCHDVQIVVEGPRCTGKTRGLLEWIQHGAMAYPGSRTLMARKTHASMGESVLSTFEDQVLTPGWTKEGGSRLRRTAYQAPNGSRIVTGGMDNVERLKSTDFDRVVFFEATEMSLDDWETMLGTLRHEAMPIQQIVADCNPDAPYHWINRRANGIDPDTGRPVMTRLLSRHRDNPILFQSDGEPTELGRTFIKSLGTMTGVRRKRLLDGIWAASEGMVYGNYDPDLHLCSKDDAPKKFKFVVAGVDWGFTNPGTIIVVGVDGDGRAWVVRQVYRTGQSIDWWCKMARVIQRKWKCSHFFCDPSAPDKIQAFRHAGIPACKASNDITLGISAVSMRMLPVEYEDGQPRLKIIGGSCIMPDQKLLEIDRPTCLEQEIEGYVWEESKEGVNYRERPIPFADHACDGLRYAIMGLDKLSNMFDDPWMIPQSARYAD